MGEDAGFGLVDRIAAREDRGLVNLAGGAQGQATNAEAAHRARMSPALRARGRGWADEIDVRRRLLLLEEMLRTQAGIAVREPAHHKAPYRALGFSLDLGPLTINDDGVGDVAIDLFSGAAIATAAMPTAQPDYDTDGLSVAGVADGYRGVVAHVSVAITQDDGTTAVITQASEWGGRYTLFKNDAVIPGCLNRFPAWCFEESIQRDSELQVVDNWVSGTVGADAVDYDIIATQGITNGSTLRFHIPDLSVNQLAAPIILEGGDRITGRFILPAATPANTLGRVYVSVRGWIYQARIDEPSIRGSVVD